MTFVDPHIAHSMIETGNAVLVDIREDHERARASIPGSRHAALSQIKAGHRPGHEGKTVIFHCASDMRTRSANDLLKGSVPGAAHILTGGLSGWSRAGLPVENAGEGENPLLHLMAKMPWARPVPETT